MKLRTITIVGLILLMGQVSVRSQTLPKRVRWSTPLCKEVDAQGREVGRIDASIVRCDQIYVSGQSIRTIDGQGLHVAVIAGYFEDYYVADLFVANDRTEGRVDVLSDKAVFVYWRKQNEAPQVSGATARVNDFETPTDRNLVSHRVREPGKTGLKKYLQKNRGHN